MSDTRPVTTEAGELAESHPRFETVEAIIHDLENRLHHVRFAAKFQSEARLEVEAISIQPFVDESTPDRNTGVQLEPEKLDDFITALEMIRHRYLEV